MLETASTMSGKYISIVGTGLSEKSTIDTQKFLDALERRMKWRWIKPLQKEIVSIHITERTDNLYISFETQQAREFYQKSSTKLMSPIGKYFQGYSLITVGVDLGVV